MAMRKLTLVLDLDSGSFSTKVVDATGKLRQLDATVESSGKTMARAQKHATGFGGAMRSVHHQLSFIHVVLAATTATVGGFTLALVKANAEAERSIALLRGLSKEATTAGRQMEAAADFKFVKQLSKEAPFSMEVLTDAFVKMKSVGIDPTKGALQALVDGLSQFGGSDEQFKRASVAIQQMLGKGVISMEELRQQLGEAFPTAIKVMSRAAGMSVADFVKEVSKGKVQAEGLLGTNGSFWREMEIEAKGSAERMMQTFSGQVSQTKTHLRDLAFAIGGLGDDGTFEQGGFMAELTKSAKDLNEWLTKPETIQGAKEFGASLADLVVNLRYLTDAAVQNAPALKALLATFIAWKGVQLMTQSVNGARLALGFLREEEGKLISVSAKSRMERAKEITDRLRGRDAVLATAKAQAQAAKQAQAAAATESRLHAQRLLELKAEAAQYQQNIALAAQQRAAASGLAYNGQRNKMAGFGSKTVGAGELSKPISVGGSANDAIQAQRALKASQEQLNRVNKEAAVTEAALNASRAKGVEASKALSGATQQMTSRAALARGAQAALGGVMTMLGGPWTMLAMGGITGVTWALKANAEEARRVEGVYDTFASANSDLSTASREVGIMLDIANGKMKKNEPTLHEVDVATRTVVGSTNGMTAALVVQTEQLRKNTIAMLENKVSKAEDAKTEMDLENKRLAAARRAKALQDTAGGGRGAGPADLARIYDTGPSLQEQMNTMLSSWAQDDINDAKKQIAELREVKTADLAKQTLDALGDLIKPAGGDGKKEKSAAQTKLENLMEDLQQMEISLPAIEQLAISMNEGTEAGLNMRQRIRELRADGVAVSDELEAKAIALAERQHNLGKAYDEVAGIFQKQRDTSAGLAEAYAQFNDSSNETTAGQQRFARALAMARAEALRLAPELENNAAAIETLDKAVAKANLDKRLTDAATAMSELRRELELTKDATPDPELGAWNAYAKKIALIDSEIDVMALDDSDAGKKALEGAKADRAEYTRQFLRDIAFQAEEEIRVNEEALMTQEEARKAAFDREIDRINKLTDVSRLSAEERALHEEKMLELRERMTKAAQDRLERDMETPMQAMVRKWADLNGNFKEMQVDWINDFLKKLRDGDKSFSDFTESMLEDYLWALAQARLAAVMEKGMEGMGDMVKHILNPEAAKTQGGGDTSGAGGGILRTIGKGIYNFFAPGNHTGGIVGSEATFMRSVNPAIFNGARKMHGGGVAGLASDEVPTILQAGEGVFTREQMKALGGGQGGGVNVEINLLNESGQNLTAEEGGKSFDGEKYIIDVVVANANRPGPLRNAIKSAK